jgi:hypothetical protein
MNTNIKLLDVKDDSKLSVAELIIKHLKEDVRRMVGVKVYAEGHSPIYLIQYTNGNEGFVNISSMDPVFESRFLEPIEALPRILKELGASKRDSVYIEGLVNSSDVAKFMYNIHILSDVIKEVSDIKSGSDAISLIALAGERLSYGPVTVNGHVVKLSDHHMDASTYKVSIDGDRVYTMDACNILKH